MMYWHLCPTIINQMGDCWSTNGSILAFILSLKIFQHFFHILIIQQSLFTILDQTDRQNCERIVCLSSRLSGGHSLMSPYHCQPRICVAHILCNKGLFINDVIIFGGYADPLPPLVIIRHFLAIPPPLLCDDVIYEPKGVQSPIC